MRDICLISRDAGHLMKMRDCPSECGTVDTYANIAIRRDTAAHNSKTPRCNHYPCQPSLVLGGDSADRE